MFTLENSPFERDDILKLARLFGATKRLREIHPADVVHALVSSSLGDEERTISTARRRYARISGFPPEESAFYGRFNPGMVRLLLDLLRTSMERS